MQHSHTTVDFILMTVDQKIEHWKEALAHISRSILPYFPPFDTLDDIHTLDDNPIIQF